MEGRTIALDGPGHMDHSWGRRDWDAIHHYEWLAVAGRDRAANMTVALVEGETLYKGPLRHSQLGRLTDLHLPGRLLHRHP